MYINDSRLKPIGASAPMWGMSRTCVGDDGLISGQTKEALSNGLALPKYFPFEDMAIMRGALI